MNKQKNGGLAFPTDSGWGQKGMCLRDYFAAKALQGLIANPTISSGLPEASTLQDLAQVGAVFAYLAADAMLEARDAATGDMGGTPTGT